MATRKRKNPLSDVDHTGLTLMLLLEFKGFQKETWMSQLSEKVSEVLRRPGNEDWGIEEALSVVVIRYVGSETRLTQLAADRHGDHPRFRHEEARELAYDLLKHFVLDKRRAIQKSFAAKVAKDRSILTTFLSSRFLPNGLFRVTTEDIKLYTFLSKSRKSTARGSVLGVDWMSALLSDAQDSAFCNQGEDFVGSTVGDVDGYITDIIDQLRSPGDGGHTMMSRIQMYVGPSVETSWILSCETALRQRRGRLDRAKAQWARASYRS